jgi:hypothetical protein
VSRVFWFAAGAGAGAYAIVKARRAAGRLRPAGLGDQLAAAQIAGRLFLHEVRAGMAEKETELRSRLGLTDPGDPDQPSLAGNTGGKVPPDGHR